MLRWSNGIARHEIKWCTSSNVASASRFGLLRDEMVFSRALVEQTCLGAPEQHKREPRRPKPVPYTKIRRLRRPGNFWRFLAIFWCFFRPNTIPDKNGEDPRRGSGQECPKGRFSVSGLCVYCQGSSEGTLSILLTAYSQPPTYLYRFCRNIPWLRLLPGDAWNSRASLRFTVFIFRQPLLP